MKETSRFTGGGSPYNQRICLRAARSSSARYGHENGKKPMKIWPMIVLFQASFGVSQKKDSMYSHEILGRYESEMDWCCKDFGIEGDSCNLRQEGQFNADGSYTWTKRRAGLLISKETGRFSIRSDSIDFYSIVLYEFEDPFCRIGCACLPYSQLRKLGDLFSKKYESKVKRFTSWFDYKDGVLFLNSIHTGYKVISKITYSGLGEGY